MPSKVESTLIELLTSYHGLNLSWVESIDGVPTPLQFARYVARNQPVVFRGAVGDWEALKKWKVGYLEEKMEGRDVNVAMTPFGNADSVVFNTEDGKDYFVKPHSFQEPFSRFVEYLRAPAEEGAAVKYAQSQDDNLHGEFLPLLPDVPADIPFATAYFDRPPDAVNVWIGNDYSVSALHKDNYENLYCQISGRKKFVLVSPLEVACVEERTLPAATYKPNGGGWKVVADEPRSVVQGWPTVDPDSLLERVGVWWKYSRPLRVILEQGDLLYLPSMWYHKVSQECGAEGICCAVNYWYDMDFSGPFHSTVGFVRDMVPILQKEINQLENEDEGELCTRRARAAMKRVCGND